MKKTEAELYVERASDDLLNKRELAVKLGISKRSVSDWMKRGYLPFLKLGTVVRFRWDDVVKKLSERRVN